MAGEKIYGEGSTLTIAPQGTGSFPPISISITPQVSFMITKETDKNSVNSVILNTSNYQTKWSPVGAGTTGPTGSIQEYLWCSEPNFSVSPGGVPGGGGVSGSLFSGSVALAPFVTGSAVGSVMYECVGNNAIAARYARITLRSDSGGQFTLRAIGKGGL